MSYLRAEEVLPKELIEALQQYVSGTTIYIPRKEKLVWGSNTDTKRFLSERNQEIFEMYRKGVTVKILAEEYSLSEKSIQRILRVKKVERDAKDN